MSQTTHLGMVYIYIYHHIPPIYHLFMVKLGMVYDIVLPTLNLDINQPPDRKAVEFVWSLSESRPGSRIEDRESRSIVIEILLRVFHIQHHRLRIAGDEAMFSEPK